MFGIAGVLLLTSCQINITIGNNNKTKNFGDETSTLSDDSITSNYETTSYSASKVETTTSNSYFEESTTITSGLDTINYYTVSFFNYDNSYLGEVKVKEGENALYDLDVPLKPSDDNYEYIFVGWDVNLENVVNDLTATAVFESKILRDFGEITWF